MEEHAKKEKEERIKALLSGYYGAKSPAGKAEGGTHSVGQQQQRSGRAGAQEAKTASIEGACQDAQKRVAQMLRSSNLEQLLTEHHSTAKDIKNLESDIQQLVYENYSKFICATDIIRDMKTRMDGAMPELNYLKSTMDVVAERSSAVGSKLQRRQEGTQELQQMQNLLQKLQVVFDLPKRMRAALEEDVMDSAVGAYAEAQPLLKKFGHRGVLRQVASQSELVAKEIAQVLKRRMSERKEDTERCVLLLRKLGEADRTLQDRYLAGRAQRIHRVLKDGAAVADAMAAVAGASAAPPGSAAARSAAAVAASVQGQVEVPEGWGFGQGSPVPSLCAFVTALDERFINAVQETATNVTRFFLPQDLPEDAAAAKRRPLLALIRESYNDYFRITRRALSDYIAMSVWRATHPEPPASHDNLQPADSTSGSGPAQSGASSEWSVAGVESYDEWGVDVLMQALSTVSADLLTVANVLPELDLRRRAGELVLGAVRHHIEECFAALEGRVMGSLAHVLAHLGTVRTAGGTARSAGSTGGAIGNATGAGEGVPPLRHAYMQTTEVLGRCLAALMQGLRVYESHMRLLSTWKVPLSDTIQACFQSTFLRFLSGFLAVSGAQFDGSDVMRDALKLLPTLEAAQNGTEASVTPLWVPSPSVPSSLLQRQRQQTPQQPHTSSGRGTAYDPCLSVLPLPPSFPASSLFKLPEPARPGLTLLLAKLCQHLQLQTIPWCSQALANSWLSTSTSASTTPEPASSLARAPSCKLTGFGIGSGAGVSGRWQAVGGSQQGSSTGPPSEEVQPFQPAELSRCLAAACTVLLGMYVELHGRQVSLMVRRSVAATPWLNHKEPRAPRALCDLLVEHIESVEAEAGQLAETGGAAAGMTPRRDTRASSSTRNERGFRAGLLFETGNVERNLAKIFQERVKVFGQPLQLTQAALVGAVIIVALKSLLECIRLQTLGRAGLQQLQLDCHYLRPMLQCSGAREQQVIDTLLDEVVTAGMERAIDSALLEPLVLDRILTSVRQQQQQQQQQQQ